jgi:hypothetical protein
MPFEPWGYEVRIGTAMDEHIVIPAVPPGSTTGRTVVIVGYRGFADQTWVKVQSVVLPNTMQILDEFAFSGSEELIRINFPEGLTEIRESAFDCAVSLMEVILPNSLQYIGKHAFRETGIIDIIIPNGVTTIGEGAFRLNEHLVSVTIGSGVQTIANYAFTDSDKLHEVIFVNNNSLKTIGHNAFSYTALRDMVMPNSVTTIGNRAFFECHDLTTITLSNNLVKIGSEAFMDCISLMSIRIPISVEEIEPFAFENCRNLHIYVEANSQPVEWDEDWAPYEDIPVIWGHTSGSSIPADLNTGFKDGVVNLSWSAPDIVASSILQGYRIERRIGTGSWTTLIQLDVDAFIHSDPDVTLGNTYQYRIRAIYSNPNYETHPSDVVSATPYTINIPRDVVALANARTVTINWNTPESIVGLIGYKVYRNDVLITEPFVVGLAFDDIDVPSGVHVYKVSAVYPSDESDAIAAEAVFVGFNPPADLVATEGVNSVNLTWAEPDDLQDTITLFSYRIDRRYAGVGEWIVLIDELPLSPSSYVDTFEITAWQIYEYRIIANYIEPDMTSIGSNIENAMPFDLPKPNNFVAIEGDGVANLSWEAPNTNPSAPTPNPLTVVGYNIYRNDVFLYTTTEYSYIDNDITGTEYTYHITAVYHHSGLDTEFESEKTNPQTVVSDNDIVDSVQTTLVGNFPNPFNPTTSIKFEIGNGKLENVSINIFNIRGQHVRTLVNGMYGAGTHTVVWNGTDDNGRSMSSGVYFYRMVADEYVNVRRMMLLK